MDILHVSTTHDWRGGQIQMLAIYQLMEDYFKQAILCPKSSVLEKKCMEKGINVYTSSRRGNVDLRFSYEIFQLCKLEKTKILHVHDSMALTLALFVIYLLPKVQLIYSRKRNNSIKNNFLKRWKYNHPRIRKIICVSKAVESIFYPLDIKKEKLRTIYDGIAIKKLHVPNHILHYEKNINYQKMLLSLEI